MQQNLLDFLHSASRLSFSTGGSCSGTKNPSADKFMFDVTVKLAKPGLFLAETRSQSLSVIAEIT